jgi:transcriptional regulator with XRE-family HTH domain
MNFELASALDIANELGRRLRAQRLAQNISQQELAGRAGISERALRTIENTGASSLDSFLRVAAALGQAGAMATLFELAPALKMLDVGPVKRQRASRCPG